VRPMLIVNPAADREFREFAAAGLRPDDDPKALEARLRVRFPKAIVRARDLSGEQVVVWYVYREGRWVS
jgi:hypothetical protein